MKQRLIHFNGDDAEVTGDLQRLGYIPVSLRTRLLNRINAMHSEFYHRAMRLFLKFDQDLTGNETPSPLTYQRERLYPRTE